MPALSTAPRGSLLGPICAASIGVLACAILMWDALCPPKVALENVARPSTKGSALVVRASAPETETELLPPLVLSGRSYGPRTEPSLRALPAPRLGAERFARRTPRAPAPHQVVPAVALEPTVAPEPRVALAGALQPPLELPPIPDVKPVIPPLPGLKDLPKVEPKVAELPAPKADAPGGANLLPLPGAAAQPGAPEVLPVPRLDAPRGNPLLAVPGVAVPVAPPNLRPLPRPALPKGDAPAVAVVQEKLPQPKPLDIPPEAAVRLGRARNAVKAGDLPLAIAEFEQYLTLVPADHPVREELAGVYTQAERYPAAATAYQELIRLNPAETAKYLLPLSDLQARMKEFRAAVASLRRALELIPADEKSAAQRLDTAARLARTHLFDDDLPSAFAVVEKYLAALRPGDANVPIRFVSFLLDLERAKDAAPFLEPFLRNLSDTPEPEILVNNVRLFALLNDKRRAYDAIELLATKLPKHLGSRVQLAENLIGTEDYDLATVVFNQIPAIRQNHVPSQLATARMLIRQFRLTQAKAVLETLRPVGTEQIVEASLVRGQYHAATGQYAEAKYFYLDVLRQFPTDPDARLGLAATYEASRDLEKAKGEYAKLPPSSRGWRRARRGLAAVLADQRQVPQALEMLTALQREAPWDHQTLVAHARVARRNGYAAQAVENLSAYLAGGSPTASSAAAIEAALGQCLLSANKVAEGEAAFRSALAASFNKSIVGHYGLVRVSQRLGGGLADTGCPPEFAGDETRYRLTISDLYADDRDDVPAFQYAFSALRADPQNLAALVRNADLQQRLARETGNTEDAIATSKALLVISPTNVRGHLALARTYSIGKNFKSSTDTYQKLISLDNDYTLPKREAARIYFADNRYDLSHDTYLSVGGGDPEAVLRSNLQTIGERAPGAGQAIQLALATQTAAPNLTADIGRLAAGQADPLAQQAIAAALADYEARTAEIRGAKLEATAKGFRGIRNYSAVGAYKSLVEAEPANVDALFDLAQTLSAIGRTRDANRAYGDVLAADPLNREAIIALERGKADLAPSFRPSIGYEDERGRNGLAQMQRLRLNSLVTLPLGDANEFAGVGYSYLNLNPRDDRDLNGDIATVVFQKKLPMYDQLLFRTKTNYEQYASRLGNRVTTDTGLTYLGDGYNLGLGGYVENVTASGESLRQDIYRYGFNLTGDYRVNRRVDVNGLYRYGYYSDSNNLHEFLLSAGYRFTPLPRQLRLVANVQGLFYSDRTINGPNAPFDLRGTIHPYFSPGSFTFYESRLEFTHIVGRDLFGGANNLTYVATYGLGYDNQSISYNRFRLDVTWDVKSWLTGGLAAEYLYSGVYRYGAVSAYLLVRLPHIYNL